MKRYSQSLPYLLVAAMLLAACGGGSGGGGDTPTLEATQPPTALTNTIVNPTVPPEPTEAPPPTEVAAGPLAQFANDGDKHNNAVTFDLVGVTAPGAGILVGWLLDDAGTAYKMGTVQPGTTTQFVDSEGRDLFALFSGALVTIEESDAATEPGVISLRGAIPPSLLPSLRQASSAAATPNGLGFAPGLTEQAQVLETHGGLLDEAAKANDNPGMRIHAEHVINIVVGQNNPQYGDLDGNGETQNPGDGFGVAEYGNGLITLLDQLLESPEASEYRLSVARNMRQCIVNVRNYATDAVGLTQTVLQAADPASALVTTDQVFQSTKAANQGLDQNANGTIEYTQQECGVAQAAQLEHPLTAIELQAAGG